MPDYPQTAWRLGLLYEAYGDAAKAKTSFERYQQLDPSAEAKSKADTHLSSMEGRRALYDAGVEEAQEILTGLLLHSMGISTQGTKHKAHLTRQQRHWASGRYKRTMSASEKLSAPYVERQLERAREPRNQARRDVQAGRDHAGDELSEWTECGAAQHAGQEPVGDHRDQPRLLQCDRGETHQHDSPGDQASRDLVDRVRKREHAGTRSVLIQRS